MFGKTNKIYLLIISKINLDKKLSLWETQCKVYFLSSCSCWVHKSLIRLLVKFRVTQFGGFQYEHNSIRGRIWWVSIWVHKRFFSWDGNLDDRTHSGARSTMKTCWVFNRNTMMSGPLLKFLNTSYKILNMCVLHSISSSYLFIWVFFFYFGVSHQNLLVLLLSSCFFSFFFVIYW